MQSDIARDVSAKLKAKLSGADNGKLANNGTTNSEAYQSYLKGRFFHSKGTNDDVQQSLKYFQEAVNLDPNFARGYAGLADAYTLLGTVYSSSMSPADVMPKARAAAEKAIELDPNLSEAYTSLAWVKFRFDWDWAGAEQDFKKAVQLDPNNAQAHQWYGEYLSCVMREAEAIAELKRARELEPFSLIMNWNLAKGYVGFRRFDEAIEEAKNVLEMDKNYVPNYRVLRVAYMYKGRNAESFDALIKDRELRGDKPERIALYREIFAAEGMPGVLAKSSEFALQDGENNKLSAVNKSYFYLLMRNKEKALYWLEESYRERLGSLVGLKSDIEWDYLYDEPRFQEIVRKMNLPK